jgi:hypothetical protein
MSKIIYSCIVYLLGSGPLELIQFYFLLIDMSSGKGVNWFPTLFDLTNMEVSFRN